MKRLTVLLLCAFLGLLLQPACAEVPQPSTLIMVYMTGSDLETKAGAASADLAEIAAALPTDGSIQVLVMASGAKAWHNGIDPDASNIYQLTPQSRSSVCDLPLSNMGDPGTLLTLLRFGSAWAADRYALILWDHGAGPMNGLCFDENFSAGGQTDYLTLQELQQALQESPFAEKKLSWIGFDACLMASVETACAVAPYAEYMIASQENEPAGGWDYRFLSALPPHADGAEAGKLIADTYSKAYPDSLADLTLSCVDLTRMPEISAACDALFSGLEVTPASYADYASLRLTSRTVGSGVPFDYDLVDFIDLMEMYRDADIAGSGGLLSLLTESVVCSWSSNPYDHGLSLYYPFYNKASFLSPWSSRSESLSFSRGYTRFLDQNAGIWMGTALTDWKMNAVTEEGAGASVHLSLQLTPEQLTQAAQARLVVISEVMSGQYFFCYATDDVVIHPDGLADCVYNHESLYIVDKDGLPLSSAIGYRIKNGDLFLITILNRYFDFDTFDLSEEWMKPAYLVYRQDENGSWKLLQILDLDAETDAWGKSTIRLDEWDYISLLDVGRIPTRDENGNLLPFTSWDASDGLAGDDIDIKDLEQGEPRFLRLQDGEKRFAMLEIRDLQNNTITSELIPLSNPYRQTIDFTGDKQVDCELFSFELQEITAVTGTYPSLDFSFRAESHTDQPIQVWLRDFKVNGQETDSVFFGSSIRLKDKAEEMSVAQMTAEKLQKTGQTFIHSIDCTLRVNDNDYNVLFSQPVHLELEYDARTLLRNTEQ